jgi:DNA-binding MarR family transcriptional regulator
VSKPRWLDDEERRTWMSFVYATRLFFEQVERDLQRDSNLPFAYYDILVILSESPRRSLRMSELAEASLSSRSRLSHAVARLEAAGWVRRESCPSDRRGSSAVLTDEGYKVLQAAAPDHVESVRAHLFDQLSPAQLDALRDINETLARHLIPSLGVTPPPVLACPDLTASA